MIEKDNSGISVRRQCGLLSVNRSTLYYEGSAKESDISLELAIYDCWRKKPFYGYRKISKKLEESFPEAGEYNVRKAMKKMNLCALYPKKNLSRASRGNKKHPYLIGGVSITAPNLVWASDITYIRIGCSFAYLVAIIDLYSRKVLSWRLSNTTHASFCVSGLREAIALYGAPLIFNTDQGSQFTSEEFIRELENEQVWISMDGKGRALDNIYVERLWRSLKYENIHLKEYQTMPELKEGLQEYFRFFNSERPHQSLGYMTPDRIYCEGRGIFKTGA